MTYQKLVNLKYKKGVSTYDLVRRFPESLQQISEIALMDVPDDILREVVMEEDALAQLIKLKRRFSKFLPNQT